MEQAEQAIYLHMLQMEDIFSTITSARHDPAMINESTLRLPLPGAYPGQKREKSPPPFDAIPLTPPSDTTVSAFLASYYLMLHDLRDNLKRWRRGLQEIAKQV